MKNDPDAPRREYKNDIYELYTQPTQALGLPYYEENFKKNKMAIVVL